MFSISNILNHFPDLQPPSFQTSLALKTQQFQARAEKSTTSQLSFLTAEGDRVSISAGSESRFSFDSYTAQGLTEGQGLDIGHQQSNTSLRSNVSLLVEGDLNEQELADIQAFLQASQELFQELNSGNVDKAVESAFSLGDLESLSTAALFFRQETTISLTARSAELALQGKNLSAPSGGPGTTIGNFLGRIGQTQEQFQINPDTLASRLPTLLSTLVDALDIPKSEEDTPLSVFEQIRKEFFRSLLEATQNLSTKPDLSNEVTEEANNSEAEDPTLIRTDESHDALANTLRDTTDI